jgi:hypothetical protein
VLTATAAVAAAVLPGRWVVLRPYFTVDGVIGHRIWCPSSTRLQRPLGSSTTDDVQILY